MSTSLIIQTEDHITGSAQQMTVTDINPNATNADLLTFAQMTAGLSKDTYVKSARVDKVELDASKSAFNVTSLTITSTVFNVVDGVCNATFGLSKFAGNNFTITISHQAVSYMDKLPVWISDNSKMLSVGWNAHGVGSGYNNRLNCTIFLDERKAQTVTGKLLIPESPTYGECVINFIFNITEEG